MAATASRHPVEQHGLGFSLCTGLAKILCWLWFALLFSILIECMGLVWWWPEQGTEHSAGMLQQEIAYLNRDFRRSLLTSNTGRFAADFARWSYTVLFQWSRLEQVINWLNTPAPAQAPVLAHRLKAAYRQVAVFVEAAITITQVFAVRLAVLTLALPAFALATLVGLVDGLVQRDLRRWGGGRESAFIYHHAKRLLFPSVLAAWLVYLSLPFSLHPSVVVLPFVLLYGVALGITATTFKKYL